MGIALALHPAIERVVELVLADYEMQLEELIAPTKARGPLEARTFVVLLAWEVAPELPKSEAAWSVRRELSVVKPSVQKLLQDIERLPSLRVRADRLREQVLGTAATKAVANG
jgi:hypothetical protein